MFALNLPLPSFDKDAVKKVQKVLDDLTEASEDGNFYGGVMSEGEAAAYALVWEWGNARQTQKGPKTTLGLNPDGQQVWLSIQAPFGYVSISQNDYMQILEQELSGMDFANWTPESVKRAIKRASKMAAERMANVMRENVPVDSGALRESITAMNPDDPDLQGNEPEIELSEAMAHSVLERVLKQLR